MKNFAKIFIFVIFSLFFCSKINILNASSPYKKQKRSQTVTPIMLFLTPSFDGTKEKSPNGSNLSQQEIEIQQYLKKAEKGDAAAQFKLGCIYQFGFATDKFLTDPADMDDRCIMQNIQNKLDIDYAKAFDWFQASAAQDYVPAKAHLAAFYLYGLGNIVPIDTEKAIALLREAATAKYIPAVNKLGDIYYDGKYAPKNIIQAFEYYSIAAQANFAPAIFNVAKMYENGEAPGQKNISLALNMYETAASMRSEKAAYRLAQIYETGEYGKTIDLHKAFHLYLQAAQLNNAPAVFEIAQMYHYGNAIVSKDEKVALALYEKAAALNHAPSILVLGNAHLSGKMGAKIDPTLSSTYYANILSNPSPDAKFELACLLVYKSIDIPNGFDFGLKLLNELSSDSDLNIAGLAENLLGEIYEYGQPEDKIERNIPKAITLYKSAAAKKNCFAQYSLGRIYQTGYASVGIPQNISLSISYYCDASKNGYDIAQNTLGLIYWQGTLVKKNPYKAMFHLKLAANQDYAEAQNNLGFIYLSIYPKDPHYKQEAIQLIKKATKQNLASAWFNLGYMYHHGIGLKKNLSLAKTYYKHAAAQNFQPAIKALKALDG